jgi:hypothetical protein
MGNGEWGMGMRRTIFGLFFLSAVLFLNFIIPPFQNPDEPQHFTIAMVYAHGEEHRDEVEAEVIRLMDKHNWWRHVGLGRPAKLPERLTQIAVFQKHFSGEDFRRMHDNIVLYHFILGKALGLFFNGSVEAAYFICRLVSILCIGGALFLFFLSLKRIGKRSFFGKDFYPAAFLFVLFLPQFLLAAVTVNSDALAVLLGSLFFYAAVVLMAGEMKPLYFAVLLSAAAAGFFIDRSVFPLLPLAAVLPFFLIKKEKYKESIVNILAFLTAAFMLIGVVASFFPLQIEHSLETFGRNLQNTGAAFPGLFSLDEFSLRFFSTTMDSFFLKFGWALFGPGIGFYVFWRLAVTLSMAGIFVFLIRRGRDFFKHWPEWMERMRKALGMKRAEKKWGRIKGGSVPGRAKSGAGEKAAGKARVSGDGFMVKVTIFFVTAVLFQLTAVWTRYGIHQFPGQGRHFFPLIIPIAFLFAAGLKWVFDAVRPGTGRIALGAFVVLEFCVLNYVVWTQMIPFFHMIMKSPYPGM